MKRKLELRYLLFVSLILSLGFLLLYAGYGDRGLPLSINTTTGILDISKYTIAFFPNALYGSFFVLTFFLAHLYIRIKLPEADPFILPVIALLSGIGLIMILRLSPDLAISRNDAILSVLNRNPEATLRNNVEILAQLGMKHFIFIVAGIFGMILMIKLMTERAFSRLSSKKYIWIVLSAIIVIVTLLFGKKINNRSLWLFGFQTVELVKLLVVFFLSAYIYEKGKGLSAYRDSGFRLWLNYSGPFVIMWFFALVPLFIQRDLGPTFLIFIVFLLMFHYAGNRKLVTIFFILLIISTGYISYSIGIPSIVRTRLDMFIDPFGKSESLARALWAISSGGIYGSGIGYGQPHKIPEVQSDFNFTAICEETGFIGGASIIIAYAIFIHRCFRIASLADSMYKRTLVIGIAVLTGIQAFIIISGNLSFIPMTGITLPFVSYGGSSMIINFLMAGIVLKVSGGKR